MLCSGIVVAKHKSRGCKGKNIYRQNWDAGCGNPAFMPCDTNMNMNSLEVGDSFEVCVAAFPNHKLVYDKSLG